MYIYIYDLLHSATELWRHRAEQRVREGEGEIQNEERTRKQTNERESGVRDIHIHTSMLGT